ncbi:mannose-6-phosphate isomerase-like protein (cupin superfamily) [Mucilaginibacter gracilis]|uniref:Mannose-6-phosphate isomerase-like protein (Cupin superfamily) n=1 Tax=Mucilaginibacter gracilis TaxID=423350 RepID=A0A495J897_9SPHI|nr:cupin domain-containing protein [Mucilaginibacter gracilis]RKR84668.1 mannose-6-phosphate isomerase-like protein (cupin superfamily) [Mucilaginibacter gracilis]
MKKILFPIALLTATLVFANGLRAAGRPSGPMLVTDTIQKAKQTQKTQMKGFKTDIQKDATENKNFRKVLYTAKHLQLVLMSLKPGEEIGSETHAKSDQFFRFEGGSGICIINSTTYIVKDGDVIIVPAGSKHNVINTDAHKDLKLYTIYAIPQHKDGIIRATKKDAEQHEAKFDGKTTE